MEKTLIHPEVTWFDATCGMKCPYCGEEIILDSDGEPKICSCGHIFRMTVYVEELKMEKE